MSTRWRRWSTWAGAALIAASVVAPAVGAGADVGTAASSTSVVPYSCSGVGFAIGIGTLPTQNVTVTIGAPTEVTVGQAYTATVDLSPIVLSFPGFPITAPVLTQLTPTNATTPSGGYAVSPELTMSGSSIAPGRSTLQITPTAAAGGQVVLTAGEIRFVVGSTGFSCVPTAGAARTTITTNVVTALTTSSTAPTSTTASTSTVPGQTTSSTTSTSTTIPGTIPPPTTAPTTSTTTTTPGATTTAPPAPTTTASSGGGSAVTVVSKATGTYTCDIYDDTGTKFNQNPLPPSTVTMHMALPDKVGVGGTVAGLVKMDPGPLNGPIKLPAGTATFAATMSVNGGTPTSIQATGGPNAADIAPNTPAVSPNMAMKFTATAPAGSSITLGVTEIEVRATNPSKLTTRCKPADAAMAGFASVAVVSGTVAAPPDLTASVQTASTGSTGTGSGTASDGGYANCAAAKAAGRGTIVKTDPAYRARLDADGDGLACEPSEVLGTSLASTGSSSTTAVSWSMVMLVLGAALVAAGRVRRPRLRTSESDDGSQSPR